MKSRILDFVLENHVFSPLLTLGVLFLAIGTASISLLFLSGIMAYGWPFFYVYLLDVKEKSAEGKKASVKRLHSIRPNVVGAH